MKLTLVLLLLIAELSAFEGLRFSSKSIKNGETLLVQYKHKEIRPLSITLDKKTFPFYRRANHAYEFYALIPFHYNTTLGPKKLHLNYQEQNIDKTVRIDDIKVIWGAYKKEQLKVDSSKITLSKKDKRRVEKEYYEAVNLYAKKSKIFQMHITLEPPLSSVVTSVFGNERLFNGARKSYHSGVDYRAVVGTPIFAIGQGKVVLVQDRFYAGLSVVVDHGQGIYSGYYHLSESSVKVGDSVNYLTSVGLSGATGRITGPHLHFSLKVHGVTVNPLVAMRQINQLISE